jgi:hypothetical protein
MYKNLMGYAVAAALTTVPVMASAAPVANPAASLSVAKSVRTGTPTAGKNKLSGGGAILAALIGAGVIAIVAVAAVKGEDDDSDSN